MECTVVGGLCSTVPLRYCLLRKPMQFTCRSENQIKVLYNWEILSFISYVLGMPDYCCVPGCKSLGTGHKFPSDPERRKKWIVNIKRLDPDTGKLWEPSPRSVVCRSHFTPEDYTTTLLGTQSLLYRPIERHLFMTYLQCMGFCNPTVLTGK